jgi:hypothetical protein
MQEMQLFQLTTVACSMFTSTTSWFDVPNLTAFNIVVDLITRNTIRRVCAAIGYNHSLLSGDDL